MRPTALLCLAVLAAATTGCDRVRVVSQTDAGPVCDATEVLVNGACRFVCRRDGDCSPGLRCNLLVGSCETWAPVDAGALPVPCTEGAVRCAPDSQSVQRCGADGGWGLNSSCPPPDGFCQDERCLACRPGTARCAAAANTLEICTDDGSAWRQVTCAPGAACVMAECAECASGQKRCSPANTAVQECQRQNVENLTWHWANVGDNFDGTCITRQCTPTPVPACVAPQCLPGATTCLSTTTVNLCSPTGSLVPTLCTAVLGSPAAECQNGACVDECADAARAKSYFGCEYWAANLDNSMDALFKGGTLSGQGTADSDFVFVVTNQSPNPGTVEVWRYTGSYTGGAPVRIKQVSLPGRNDPATKGLLKIPVPWQSISPNALNAGEGNSGRARYAYRLVSTRPVSAYQFNPIDAVKYTKACTGTAGQTDCSCNEYSDYGDQLTCLFGGGHPGVCTQTPSGKKCGYGTYSNDASLLLPAHILGTSHVVVAPHHSHINDPSTTPTTVIKRSAELVIVATQDNTTVTLKPSADTLAGAALGPSWPAVPAIARASTPAAIVLQSYEVLQLATDSTGADYDCYTAGGASWCRKGNDLTGTVVTSDKPVAVFAGHSCQNIPNSRPYCDHNEEQIFPFATWGKTFIAVPSFPLRLNNNTFPSVSAAPDHFKIVAGCPVTQPQCNPLGTTLTLNPAPAAANVLAPNNCLAGTSLTANNCRLAGGGFVEFKSAVPFSITADQPIAVAQFFPGQGPVSAIPAPTDPAEGDPSMVLLPPIEQWRARYTVLASTGLLDNYIGLAIDSSRVASVLVDGAAINITPGGTLPGDPKQVGSTTFVVKNHAVSTGTHTIQVNPKPGQTSVPGAGVTVYGYDAQVSYGYTGGLDLGSIVTGINPGG